VPVSDRILRAPADHVQLPLEGQVVGHRRVTADKYLPDEGFPGLGRFAQGAIVGRQIAPPQQRLAFLANDALKLRLAPLPLGAVRRQKHQPAAVLLGPRQPNPGLLARLLEKLVGHLNQNARPVARIVFATAGAAMPEVDQDRQRIADDRMGLPAFDVDHEADSTGIVLVLRVVKALFGRQPGEREAALRALTVSAFGHLQYSFN